jgi:flagellar biosynthesis protein FlhG
MSDPKDDGDAESPALDVPIEVAAEGTEGGDNIDGIEPVDPAEVSHVTEPGGDSGPSDVHAPEPSGPAGPMSTSAPARPRPRIVAFASGRGGTGRSLLAANVAVYLAQAAKKVVALDADPAGGPLHQLLGASRPPRGFGELLRGKITRLAELTVDTPIAGVSLVGGEGAAFGASRVKVSAKAALSAIYALEVDYVVVDLGPADSSFAVDLWLAADVPILVTLPDPSSIEATYRFVRSGFVRRLRSIRGLDRLVTNPVGPPPAATDLFRAVRESSPALLEKLEHEIRRYRPGFVVNQTRTLADLKLGGWMATAARRRLGHAFEYLGHVESDETVWLAARRRRSLVAEYPDAKASKNIERLGRRILSLESERETARPPAGPLRLEEEQTFYEILETEPGVSDEEVRRAHRLIKEIYASGSLVIAGLYEDHELTELHARVNAAHDTLFAPERRRLYDLALPEADLARAVRAAAQIGRRGNASGTTPNPIEERPEQSQAALDPDAEVTGALLKKLRESRGLELADISQRTKISERYLRALEDEKFAEMPAAVYVRGYVTEYARALRLDPHRIAESYLARFRKAAAPPTPSSAAP